MSYVRGPVASETMRKIMSRAANNVAEQISFVSTESGMAPFPRGDTPIERAFFLALWAEIKFGQHDLDTIWAPPAGHNSPLIRMGVENPLIIYSQITVLDWKVDFLIGIDDSERKLKWLVVECDGHDFHERTKAQAKTDRSRDRRLQAAGYTVFRFTGSEIHNDPCGCANSVIDWANEQLFFGDDA